MATRDLLKSGVSLPLVGTVSIVGIVAGAAVLFTLIKFSKGSKVASKTTKISYRK